MINLGMFTAAAGIEYHSVVERGLWRCIDLERSSGFGGK